MKRFWTGGPLLPLSNGSQQATWMREESPVFKRGSVNFVANQVGVPTEMYLQYDWQGRTIEYHRAEIRKLFGFRESTVTDGEQLKQWLIAEVLPLEHQEEVLREEAYAWFRRNHLEAPTPSRLRRQIGL